MNKLKGGDANCIGVQNVEKCTTMELIAFNNYVKKGGDESVKNN